MPNGCPDHPYFEHDATSSSSNSSSCSSGCCSRNSCSSSGGCYSSSSCSSSLCTSCSSGCCSGGGRLLGCHNSFMSNCCTTSSGAAATTSPHTPRFHDFTLRIPKEPSLATSPHKPEPSHPMGVAINGVLIITTHYNSSHPENAAPIPTTSNFDNCNGHSDKSGTYHYHACPNCILSSLSLPTTFPPTSTPSPVLGIALDGFPILGPYDTSGNLVTSISLSACNFDMFANAYRFTPDAPYAPTCLVGKTLNDPFLSSTTSSTSGICPKNGIDNVYCSGPTCKPNNQVRRSDSRINFETYY